MKKIFFHERNEKFKKIFGIKSSNKGRTREFIAKLSRGLMLPIAMLPVAGLFLGIGATIATQAGNAGILGLETFGRFIRNAGDVIFGALPALFAIAVAIAFTKDAGVAGLSALIGYLVFAGLQTALLEPVIGENGQIAGYNLLFYTEGVLGEVSKDAGIPTSVIGTTLGLTQLQTSVFGGLLVGFLVAWLYNKFKNIQLPAVLGFFNGARFIPIVTFAAIFPVALLTMILWPLIGVGLTYFGGILGSNMYGFNSFIFGFIERALVPFGLHHAFYSPLWYSSVGGNLSLDDLAIVSGAFTDINGDGSNDKWSDLAAAFGGDVSSSSISGDQVIWSYVNSTFAGRNVILMNGETATITFSDFTSSVYSQHLSTLGFGGQMTSQGVNIGQYLQGKYTFMIFGLPAAAIAMIYAAPKENRKMASSVVIAAGFTSLLTGITEPIEFTFLFLAPWLFWGFHAFMCALSFGLMNWIGLIFPEAAPHIGMTFSGGILDWIIFGAIQIPGGSNAWWPLLFGLAYAPIYFFFFKWAIKRFDLATPGRGENTSLFTKKDFLAKKDNLNLNHQTNFDPIAIEIIKSYGGLKNIKNVDACITKLRIEVENQTAVNENRLKKELGAFGTIRPSAKSVYAVYGPKADFYKNKIIEIIKKVSQNPKMENEIFESNNNKNLDVNSSSKENNLNNFNDVIKVYAPVDGEVINIENVADETFSKKMIGDGVAIIPSNNAFFAPIDGKVSSVFHTGHAYSFKAKDGSEILVHIGIDATTLKIKNETGEIVKLFKPIASENQNVNLKNEIALVNQRLIRLKDKAVTPVIILNETLANRKIKIIAKGKVSKGDLLFIVE